MADTKGMIQQIIKYADGTETVINYNLDGTVIKEPEAPVETPAEEVVETLPPEGQLEEPSEEVS